MIVSLTPEEVWLDVLADALPWQPPAQHTVVLAPHPDDETLATGGLIVQLREAGCEVTVVAVTDGENCYSGERGFAEVRSLEQTCALARLGVDEEHLIRLHMPDSGLSEYEGTLEAALKGVIAPGVHLVAPWSHDFHPDHEVCGRVARKVAQLMRLKLCYYLFWSWHRGTPELLAGQTLFRLPLTAQQQTAKRAALACHRSQLAHPTREPILPVRLLAPAFRDFEVFLPA